MKYLIGLFWILLFVGGCRRYSPLKKENGRYFVELSEKSINNVEIIDWKVGNFGAHTVTKGIQVEVQLPMLEDDGIRTLYKEFKVDSWIVRIKRVSENGSSQYLGTVIVPIVFDNVSTGHTRVSGGSAYKGNHVYFRLNYSAASVSVRLDNLKCPAFNHNKVVDDYKIVENPNKFEKTSYMVYRTRPFIENMRTAQLTPEVINGGTSLVGEYFLEFGLYSSQEKYLFGELLPFDSYLAVRQEKDIFIKECLGSDTPPPPSSNDSRGGGIKGFRLK